MSFNTVKDSRGHTVRGLWERNGRYYAQFRIPEKRSPVKVPLVDAEGNSISTVPQARAAQQKLLAQRDANTLPVLTKTPTLAEWVTTYLDWLRATNAKHELTIDKEDGALSLWSDRMGTIRLSQLRRSHVNEFIAWRKDEYEVSNRTINLDIIALNNCLNHAIQEGRIQRLPTENWQPLEHVSPKRPLWTNEQIESICTKAKEIGENGDLLADYIRLMKYSGARRDAAIKVAWDDINWTREQITLRTKYSTTVVMDFNPALKTHLKDMLARRPGNCKWLFPSPMNPEEHAKNLQGSLETAREAAGLSEFQFHDLRHFFISSCVMAGIDYLTIARWVGHKDGGLLIGKTYGHLNDTHSKNMAGKLKL
jgi:integrase